MSSQQNTRYQEPFSPPSSSSLSSPSSPSSSSPQSTQILKHTNLHHNTPTSGPPKNSPGQKRKWPKQPYPQSGCGGSIIEVELSAPALDLWDWNTIDDSEQIPENQNPGRAGKAIRAVRDVSGSAAGKVGGWVMGIGKERGGKEEGRGGEREKERNLSPFLSDSDEEVPVDKRKVFDTVDSGCPGRYTASENMVDGKTRGGGCVDPH